MFQARRFFERVLAVILIAVLSSCASQTNIAQHDRKETHDSEIYLSSHVHDRDSVAVMVKVQSVADTIYRDSIVYRYRSRIIRDTIIMTDTMHVSDTIRVVQYIDNDTWFDEITDKVGGISLLLLVLILIVQFLKLK